ncbi:MAG: hypothetical protein AAF696_28370 [Bacteroidota bacterium]
MYITSLTVLSLFVLAMIQGWYASKSVENHILIEEQLTHEISELELQIHDLRSLLVEKESDLKVHEELLDEKYIELDFLNKEISKWKGLYRNAKSAEKPNPAIAVKAHTQAEGSSFSSLRMR